MDCKDKLKIIEDKRKTPRNKTGHPIDSLAKVSSDKFMVDLQILFDSENHIISQADITILKLMAEYAGISD